MTDAMLEARLFANAGTKQGHRRLIEPDWAAIHRELKRKHVTLQILWDEYIERIAVHVRSSGNHQHSTVPEHMPSSHRRYADWTIDRIRQEAAGIGPATAALCELILDRRPHPEQGFRACRGILRLKGAFGRERLEAAAARAIDIGGLSYGSVRSILDHKLDRQAANKRSADGVPIIHPNIRGSRYYN